VPLGSWKKYEGLLPESPRHYPCKNHIGQARTHTGTMVKTKNPTIHLNCFPIFKKYPMLKLN